ncbi:DMT family transporter [Streptomyces albofaciens JCM 4342]|uniref:DMT family transporter n=1 Tax=Streptomyces albofaciens TaxID=66866 RepID=UPI00123914F0|nr:DMT family transporter [Streptomyces albofaciens]KAA6221433.1 DMT family transporter [Streptomyces albofaciens JCM 4342]
MHGPVTAPPPHRPASRSTVVLLRVVFVAVAVLSLGFLAWVTLLRAAVVQRRPLGWWVFGADLALFAGAVVLAGGRDENSWQVNTGAGLVVLQMAAAVTYYLVVDVRAYRVAPGRQAYGPPGAGPAYGGPPGAGPVPAAMPHAPNPYTGVQPPSQPPRQAADPLPQDWPYAQTRTQGSFQPHPQPLAHPAPQPQPAAPYDPPAAPYGAQPQRIDQVRAELDELSDYLRREEGR